MQNFRSIIAQPQLVNELIASKTPCLFKYFNMHNEIYYACGILTENAIDAYTFLIYPMMMQENPTAYHGIKQYIYKKTVTDIQVIILKEIF